MIFLSLGSNAAPAWKGNLAHYTSGSTRKREVGREVSVGRFDVSTVKGFPFILVYGRRCTGKSVLTMTLIKRFAHFPTGLVMCVSEGSDASDYSRHFPQRFIYRTTSPHVLEELLESQRRVKKEVERLGRSWSDPAVVRLASKLVVIDDGAYDKRLMDSEVLRVLAMAGRHLYIAVIITAQHTTSIPSNVRNNFDYLFATKIESVSQFRTIMEDFLDTVEHKPSVWRKIVRACTEGYWTFVVQMNSNANIMRRIFYMDPPLDQGEYRFGSDGFWDMDAVADREARLLADRASEKATAPAEETPTARAPDAIVVKI